jgi:hypothetical protein
VLSIRFQPAVAICYVYRITADYIKKPGAGISRRERRRNGRKARKGVEQNPKKHGSAKSVTPGIRVLDERTAKVQGNALLPQVESMDKLASGMLQPRRDFSKVRFNSKCLT